jgi:hypothetical protein
MLASTLTFTPLEKVEIQKPSTLEKNAMKILTCSITTMALALHNLAMPIIQSMIQGLVFGGFLGILAGGAILIANYNNNPQNHYKRASALALFGLEAGAQNFLCASITGKILQATINILAGKIIAIASIIFLGIVFYKNSNKILSSENTKLNFKLF